MKVVEEAITALCDIEGRPGLTLFMGGYRITLTLEEARSLVGSVGAALSGASGDATSGGSADDTPNRAAIAADVRDRVISWAQITDGVQRK
jgi:hypothetical protein